jgi:hypothetical protein
LHILIVSSLLDKAASPRELVDTTRDCFFLTLAVLKNSELKAKEEENDKTCGNNTGDQTKTMRTQSTEITVFLQILKLTDFFLKERSRKR